MVSKEKLKEMATLLMERETLEEPDLDKLFEGLTPKPAAS